jgi:hypothetical protein
MCSVVYGGVHKKKRKIKRDYSICLELLNRYDMVLELLSEFWIVIVMGFSGD